MNRPAPFTTDDQRWRALAARDRAAEGAFVYGVRTTGVYCRPGCASRRPRRENVEFFDHATAAERAGYRACRRCRPQATVSPRQRTLALVAGACRQLEQVQEPPSLPELAAHAGLSRWHFQRLFKSVVGVTPRQYFAGQRAQHLRERLRTDGSVTEAIHNAGFGSASSAYDGTGDELAMTPSAFRAGGAGEVIHCAGASCSLGGVAIAATGRGVCAIELADDADSALARVERDFPRACIEPGGAALEQMLSAVVALIESPARGLELPLDIRGSAFRRRVWQALRGIPAGATLSYADLAARIARPNAARAVANACAANRLAVAVPCHRVIRADGGLGGYRWGPDRKRELLQRERIKPHEQ